MWFVLCQKKLCSINNIPYIDPHCFIKAVSKKQQMSTLHSNEVGIENHVIVDQILKKKRIRRKCPHNKEKHNCKDCSPHCFCEHLRQRSQCKDCSPHCFCEHQLRRYWCKICGGGGICEHQRKRSQSKDCKGGKIGSTIS